MTIISTGAPIEIKHNKTKLILLITGSLIFIAGGVWLLMHTPVPNIPLLNSPVFVKIAGVASILFFGLCFTVMIKKIRDKNPAIVISDKGIFDNVSGVSAGNILWKDIKEIKSINTFNQRCLMVIVNNPEYYINKQPNVLKRKSMEINYRNFGSPISISANNLDCNFDDLKNILDSKLAFFGNHKKNYPAKI